MIDIVVLLPYYRCTKIQRLQMTTVQDTNIHNFAGKINNFPSAIFTEFPFSVDGTSDDLDIPIKKVFADVAYVEKHNLCSINSINWARILVQVRYEFKMSCAESDHFIFLDCPLHLLLLSLSTIKG